MKIYFGTPQFGRGIPHFFTDNRKIVAVSTYKITYIYVLYIKFFINNFADVKPECNFFKKTDEVVETGVKCDKTWQKHGQKTDRSSMCKNNNRDTGTTLPSRQMIVQPKLELTTPGDSYEREADRMADFVMRRQYTGIPTEMPSAASVVHPTISRSVSGSEGVAVDTATEGGINASRGGGQPMPEALRSQMESGFGADFSGVRLHTDSRAADLSRSIQAKAFAYGNDIYFNRGQYSPDTAAGQHLIAHELTHVVQQSGKVGRIPIDPPDGFYEMTAKQSELYKVKLEETDIPMDIISLSGSVLGFIGDLLSFPVEYDKVKNSYKFLKKINFEKLREVYFHLSNLQKKYNKCKQTSDLFAYYAVVTSCLSLINCINECCEKGENGNLEIIDIINLIYSLSVFISNLVCTPRGALLLAKHPIVLAVAAGWSFGTAIGDIINFGIEKILGDSLGALIYEWTHPMH